MQSSHYYGSRVRRRHRPGWESIPTAAVAKILFAGFVVWLVHVALVTAGPAAGSSATLKRSGDRGPSLSLGARVLQPPASALRKALPSPALAGQGGFDVRGKPTVSVALINQVLSAYGSPMAGQGQAIYDLGVKYGIDPAFCLAFFVHESAAGTRGEAVITHSVGNIRATPGAPSADGYRYYTTWLEGAEDWYRLIGALYVGRWGLTTVVRILPVYAPSGDNNDTAAYIDDVEQLVSAWRAQSS